MCVLSCEPSPKVVDISFILCYQFLFFSLVDVFNATFMFSLYHMDSHFAANQAKFLRVAVSSFYDYLSVALKCYQEFDDSLRVE